MNPTPLEEPAYTRLLPRDALQVLGRLEFPARQKMEGGLTGRHRSPHIGASVEFAEHRAYAPGDDLRTLDWRVYAKSDRYYVKQFIDETNLRATILVDASGSMNYRGKAAHPREGQALSKFEYARYLAAAFSFLLARQQDAVGLVTFADRIQAQIKAACRGGQVRRILETLQNTAPGEDTRLPETLHTVAEKIPARGLVVLISDLFGEPEAILEALHHFRFRRHELLIFHVMADEELSFPFDRVHDFIDLEEPGSRLRIDAQGLRAQYLENIRNFVDQIERGCGRLKADYIPLNTRDPYEQVLAGFLARRNRTT